MNLDYQYLLPRSFSPLSRVWMYQSSRLFTMSEALQIEEKLAAFVADWQAHGAGVRGWGTLFFGQFLVLMADETEVAVSGCSTDSSVRFVKSLGQQFGVDFFDRTILAFVVKEKIQTLPLQQLTYAFENGFITADTLYFNNLVATKEALQKDWMIPVKASWLAKKLRLTA